ncbi:hypothetical protein FGG08_002684 [Glutinoglossum americanum]|uniref:RED-like N-terminal domain-containing protein n=1 Tax=Glutinoglossum americanum TaxID=1670608 RepID=A0A9P8IEM2_9PEZI|nr:hypothetical protein FGG08_002684 [Glutinoglossum americanum]
MNNEQFRRLLLDKNAQKSSNNEKTAVGATPRRDGLTLGSKMRSSIPMTPRSVLGSGGVDFARQLAERDRPQQSQRKFRSTATPKGAKLPSGYRDRTQDRVSEEEDGKASRIQALEEMWKLDQIDRATFEKLRDEIVGGDISSTHLVKGLDYKLLERVKRGEDVLNKSPAAEGEEKAGESVLDEELEKLESREIRPITKEKAAKKGDMAPPSGPGAVAGRKRTRDEILAELKASRQAAKAAQQPTLGPKFRKIGEPKEKSRIERDERGREVLITVDKDGKVKRKVKKGIPEQNTGESSRNGLLMPEKGVKPLGMEVPDFAAKAPAEEPEEDIDIFEGVGADYDPFAGLGEDDDDDSSSEDGEDRETSGKKSLVRKDDENDGTKSPRPDEPTSSGNCETLLPPPIREPSTAPRNYFSTPTAPQEPPPISNPTAPLNPLADPTILAALRKASTIDPLGSSSALHDPEEAAREARRRKLLDTHDRDADDMDLGFGSSRFEDEEDMEEKRVKLSAWGGGDGKEGGGGGGGGGGDGKGKRKRGPKKRKGDVNSAADVMKVLEGRRRKGGGEGG